MIITGIVTKQDKAYSVGDALMDTGGENTPIITEIVWARTGFGKGEKGGWESYTAKTDSNSAIVIPAHNVAEMHVELEGKKGKKKTTSTVEDAEANVELPDA